MKKAFREVRLSKANLKKLGVINAIIEEYQDEGYVLTLRQLYYQLVSRDIIPNKQSEYAKISTLLKEGRMAGIVDWDAIEDRLRVPYLPYYNASPEEALQDAIDQYRLDRQKGQDTYLEVWVEKDALSGVLRRITEKYHVRLLVNRGYGSVSAIHDAYNRIAVKLKEGKQAKILYLGDHDPSGMDMIRDIKERIMEMLITINGRLCLEQRFGYDYENNKNFMDWYRRTCLEHEDFVWDYEENKNLVFTPEIAWIYFSFVVEPIALTMEQIKQYNPPENPAKLSDPRAVWYVEKFGYKSWEVDALNPETLNALLTKSIESNIDMEKFNEVLGLEEIDINILKSIEL